MLRRRDIALVTLLATGACHHESPTRPSGTPAPRAAQDAGLRTGLPPLAAQPPATTRDAGMTTIGFQGMEDSLLAPVVRQAPNVFLGKLIKVGAPPGFWSGYAKAKQTLTYQVERSLKGHVPPETTLTY